MKKMLFVPFIHALFEALCKLAEFFCEVVIPDMLCWASVDMAVFLCLSRFRFDDEVGEWNMFLEVNGEEGGFVVLYGGDVLANVVAILPGG